MESSEQINELATALSKAQGEMDGAKKDTKNPFFNSKYADLSSVWDACRKPLSNNGISIIQSPEESVNGIAIETMMIHSSGQWIKSRYSMPVSKVDAQAVGSAITYARRYALAAIVGIAPEDDDGNAAAMAQKKQDTAPPKKQDTAPQKKELPAYSDDKITANVAAWQAAIVSGKHTAESIINTISTKNTLTDTQKDLIRSLGAKNGNT